MSGVQSGADGGTMSRRGRRRACERLVAGQSVLAALLLACLLHIGIYAELAHAEKSAYEQLVSFGFPIGLLPHIVKGYELAANGKFAVYMENKCEIDIPGAFPVVYSAKIAGSLSYQSLRDLSGINVKIYKFIWLPITAISVQGDDLKFEVGIISATYPIHPNFDYNPYCVGDDDLAEQLLYLDE